MGNITIVLFIHYFGSISTSQIRLRIFARDFSNDAILSKEVPFEGRIDTAPHLGDKIPKTRTWGMNRHFQFQAKSNGESVTCKRPSIGQVGCKIKRSKFKATRSRNVLVAKRYDSLMDDHINFKLGGNYRRVAKCATHFLDHKAKINRK